jgi:hypothetical protein
VKNEYWEWRKRKEKRGTGKENREVRREQYCKSLTETMLARI